jgi:hypothetical protein
MLETKDSCLQILGEIEAIAEQNSVVSSYFATNALISLKKISLNNYKNLMKFFGTLRFYKRYTFFNLEDLELKIAGHLIAPHSLKVVGYVNSSDNTFGLLSMSNQKTYKKQDESHGMAQIGTTSYLIYVNDKHISNLKLSEL